MLNEADFNAWCHQLGITHETRERIEAIRHSPPARTVGGRLKNVSGCYPSKKMGVTIQFESHRVELARIIQFEFDPDVLEYYDQPYGGVELVYQSKKRRLVRTTCTPDFFVIRKDRAGWEECKPEVSLIKLSEEQPNRYSRDEIGSWRCPPGEEYASRFGLTFRVWSDAEVSWVFQENTSYLDDYWRYEYPEVDLSIVASVQRLVKDQRGISLAELLAADTGATSDDIYALIASQVIYVDLYQERLSIPHNVKLFQNRDIALAYGQALEIGETFQPKGFQKFTISTGVRLNWDGQVWEIINTGQTKTSLQPVDGPIIHILNTQLNVLIETGEISPVHSNSSYDSREKENAIQEILAQTSSRNIEKARQRYEVIQPYLGELAPTCPAKTIKRWRDRYIAAEKKFGNGFVGLIPKHRQQGNRTSKISSEVQEYMDDFIQKHYETIKQRSAHSVYKSFKLQLEESHPSWVVPSYPTFCKFIKKRSGPRQTRLRKGRRAAIQEEPMYWELFFKTPRHGNRPFEIVHIDHTPMDVELVSSLEALSFCSHVVDGLIKPQEIANQAWLSIMIDAFSRRILAVYVSYEPPSYRTCMMVLRICVNRFNRLPQTIVVDNGADFRSNYFSQLAAFYQITLKYRPPAYARFGALVERLFGTNNEKFLNNLQGNTQARKKRQMTKAVDPKRNAIWNLPDLYEYLCTWLYEVYDNAVHEMLDQSPREAFMNGLAIGGAREHRRVEYDENFKILTSAAPKPETRMVQSTRGIKIFNIWYWSDHFRDPDLEKQKVEVRYDPFNIGIAYAFVKKQWVKCTSSYFVVLNERTEKEVQLASEEIKKRKRASGKKVEVSDREIAQLLQTVEEHEELLKERRKAIDNQAILKVIDGSLSNQSTLSDQKMSEESYLQVASNLNKPETLSLLAFEAKSDEDEFEIYGEY